MIHAHCASNTEMGLLVKSSEFNELVRRAAAIDLLPRNAWYLQIGDNSQPRWVGDDVILNSQPAESELQRIEDWFLSILPLEGEMRTLSLSALRVLHQSFQENEI